MKFSNVISPLTLINNNNNENTTTVTLSKTCPNSDVQLYIPKLRGCCGFRGNCTGFSLLKPLPPLAYPEGDFVNNNNSLFLPICPSGTIFDTNVDGCCPERACWDGSQPIVLLDQLQLCDNGYTLNILTQTCCPTQCKDGKTKAIDPIEIRCINTPENVPPTSTCAAVDIKDLLFTYWGCPANFYLFSTELSSSSSVKVISPSCCPLSSKNTTSCPYARNPIGLNEANNLPICDLLFYYSDEFKKCCPTALCPGSLAAPTYPQFCKSSSSNYQLPLCNSTKGEYYENLVGGCCPASTICDNNFLGGYKLSIYKRSSNEGCFDGYTKKIVGGNNSNNIYNSEEEVEFCCAQPQPCPDGTTYVAMDWIFSVCEFLDPFFGAYGSHIFYAPYDTFYHTNSATGLTYSCPGAIAAKSGNIAELCSHQGEYSNYNIMNLFTTLLVSPDFQNFPPYGGCPYGSVASDVASVCCETRCNINYHIWTADGNQVLPLRNPSNNFLNPYSYSDPTIPYCTCSPTYDFSYSYDVCGGTVEYFPLLNRCCFYG